MTTTILFILFGHFFGDFIIQPDKIAANKWRSELALTQHVLLYMTGLLLFTILGAQPAMEDIPYYIGWALTNGFFHWFTDYVISKDRKVYWDEKDYKMYFIMVGLDQFFHYAVLAITYSILINFVI